ncbi:MAG: hypothetical protein JW888_03235 [Pirellulales bacterium]|nr:hypothetical protein [Pirellulales bacterium]
MQRSTDAILAAELEKLASAASDVEIGTKVVGRVARKLPNDMFQVELELAESADRVLRVACDVLDEVGRIRDDVVASDAAPTVAAVVGSGFLNLNPAVVTVEVAPLAADRARVTVTGTAKEGLIKQHAGEKAARRIADKLRQSLGGFSTGIVTVGGADST